MYGTEHENEYDEPPDKPEPNWLRLFIPKYWPKWVKIAIAASGSVVLIAIGVGVYVGVDNKTTEPRNTTMSVLSTTTALTNTVATTSATDDHIYDKP